MLALFECHRTANLTINLEFDLAQVTFPWQIVGQGIVESIVAKVEAIAKFPIPSNKKKLMRLLGMEGYYRRLFRSCGAHYANLIIYLIKCLLNGFYELIIQYNSTMIMVIWGFLPNNITQKPCFLYNSLAALVGIAKLKMSLD